MNQMNHRRSEGARGRETRALTVVSVLLWTTLRNEVPVLLSATSQEERDRSVLRLAPEKKAWLPPKSVMDHLSATTSDRYRTRLFDSSRIHHLDPSAKNYRAEHEFFIDAFFRHRWYSGNHKRDGPSLLQAWNAYIHNLEDVGRDAWNDKLIKARVKFEKRTPTGARYKLHRLSREKGLPCLSWGDSCPCCVNNFARAPKEAYLLNSPWWRVRISSEMYEGIDYLKSLYDRAGKTFSGGPSAAQDVPHRTAQPDPVRQSSVGSGLPSIPGRGIAAPPDEITRPTSVHVAVVQQLLN
uniref:Uncharacterized protein n=1 Tax=Peronospora matthiolae TaxID=2874970 RepID=A0AAV1VLY5_9STRA